MKVNVVTDLYGNPMDYLLTKANIDYREALYKLSNMMNIQTSFGDKDYVGNISEELGKEKGINLYALKKAIVKTHYLNPSET